MSHTEWPQGLPIFDENWGMNTYVRIYQMGANWGEGGSVATNISDDVTGWPSYLNPGGTVNRPQSVAALSVKFQIINPDNISVTSSIHPSAVNNDFHAIAGGPSTPLYSYPDIDLNHIYDSYNIINFPTDPPPPADEEVVEIGMFQNVTFQLEFQETTSGVDGTFNYYTFLITGIDNYAQSSLDTYIQSENIIISLANDTLNTTQQLSNGYTQFGLGDAWLPPGDYTLMLTTAAADFHFYSFTIEDNTSLDTQVDISYSDFTII